MYLFIYSFLWGTFQWRSFWQSRTIFPSNFFVMSLGCVFSRRSSKSSFFQICLWNLLNSAPWQKLNSWGLHFAKATFWAKDIWKSVSIFLINFFILYLDWVFQLTSLNPYSFLDLAIQAAKQFHWMQKLMALKLYFTRRIF